MNSVIIQDVFNRDVKPFDKVGVLVKCYGFGGIHRAYIMPGVYLGKGRYGYEFSYTNAYGHKKVVRIREPQVVRKGGRK